MNYCFCIVYSTDYYSVYYCPVMATHLILMYALWPYYYSCLHGSLLLLMHTAGNSETVGPRSSQEQKVSSSLSSAGEYINDLIPFDLIPLIIWKCRVIVQIQQDFP